MTPPPKVTQWINENFPKPRVDPEWLDGCCEWLTGDQHIDPFTSFPEFVHQVRNQLLQSNLQDSMLYGTGLDVHIERFTGNLRGPPVLVQIVAITEIGISAFQLEQVRAAREERLMSGVGNEEGEEDGDIDIEGEGPMPKYPRATLRFKLSDGVTTLEAMEYRALPQISLGPTPLGYKLKGTRIQNGMAFLEPATVTPLGGAVEGLEDLQREDFKRGLRERLGLPCEADPPTSIAAHPPVVAARSPLREIPPPPSPPLFPQHDDDMDMGARHRRVPASSSTALSTSSSKNTSDKRHIIGLPRGRKSNTSTTTSDNKHISESEEPELDLEIDRQRRPSAAERNTLTYAAAYRKNPSASHYFNKTNSKRDPDDINMDVENLDFNFSPTRRQLARTYRPSPSTSVNVPLMQMQRRNDKSFDFDLLDEIDQDENQPPPTGQRQPADTVASRDIKGNGRAEPVFVDHRNPSLSKFDDASSDDYGMMGIDDDDFADADFLEKLDRVETQALLGDATTAGGMNPPPSSGLGFGSVGRFSGSGSGPGSSYIMDGDTKKTSSASASAPIASSSAVSTKPLGVIEIDSSDEDDGMVGTEDKENDPVATRHVRRRTQDLNEKGRVFASQGRNSGRRNDGLGSQNQGRSQGLKPRMALTIPDDVIDLSDSDD